MSKPTFYHPTLTNLDAQVALLPEEAAHARNARRLKLDSEVKLVNGRGLVGEGTICELDRNSLKIELNSFQEISKANPQVTVITAIPKGDRHKTMVDMLTQLGVSGIIALNCERSVTKYSTNLLAKWQRVAIEAIKQSQNSWLPNFSGFASLSEALTWLSENNKGQAYYADGSGSRLTNNNAISTNTAVLIGPEGGFSPNEMQLLARAEISPVKLAEAILRTETAAVTAAAHLVS